MVAPGKRTTEAVRGFIAPERLQSRNSNLPLSAEFALRLSPDSPIRPIFNGEQTESRSKGNGTHCEAITGRWMETGIRRGNMSFGIFAPFMVCSCRRTGISNHGHLKNFVRWMTTCMNVKRGFAGALRAHRGFPAAPRDTAASGNQEEHHAEPDLLIASCPVRESKRTLNVPDRGTTGSVKQCQIHVFYSASE